MMGLVANKIPDSGVTEGSRRVPPNQAEKKKLGEMKKAVEDAETDMETLGKETLQAITCSECERNCKKEDTKSGKWAKSHGKIKKQELWPHISVMRKYVKKTTFENLDFEMFVAGETKTILSMEDEGQAKGRLSLLCKLAHWYCRSQDWNAVKGLYEAVMDSIELGEESWTSDFSHYESMVPYGRQVKSSKDGEKEKKKDKIDIYWCKAYNKGTCSENSPHLTQINDQSVPVVHMCAFCWHKEGKKVDHKETECMAKKSQ